MLRYVYTVIHRVDSGLAVSAVLVAPVMIAAASVVPE